MSALRAGVAGGVAAAAALAAAGLVDALSTSAPSLVGVVDQWIVRAVPGVISRVAIDAVGAANKPLLVAVTVVLAIVAGVLLGPLVGRRRLLGPCAFLGAAGLAVTSATTLENVSVGGSAIAAGAAAAVGATTLHMLLNVGSVPGPAPEPGLLPAAPDPDRRAFLVGAATAAAGVGATLLATRWLGPSGAAVAHRARVDLPVSGEGLARVGEPAVKGLTPLVTSNADFFRIDEALVVPQVDVPRWRLRISGMVDRPLDLSFDELLALPLVERSVTLACVSNEVGGRLVGTARWSGVLLADLLRRAEVQPDATQVVGRSVDGFTAGFPIDAAFDGRDAMVAVSMNGEPLPLAHGFPARLLVPGLYGFVSATKWLTEIQLTTFEAFEAYWVQRGWSARAPVKVQSRIDVPRDYAPITAGRTAVAGVAWAPTRGIAAVEVRVDAGPWKPARLGPSVGADSWRQWVHEWDATPGNHIVQVRATTDDGEVQTDTKKKSFPDGATGHHEIHVSVVG